MPATNSSAPSNRMNGLIQMRSLPVWGRVGEPCAVLIGVAVLVTLTVDVLVAFAAGVAVAPTTCVLTSIAVAVAPTTCVLFGATVLVG